MSQQQGPLLLLLGAGASRPFGVPTMPEFLPEPRWRRLDEGVAGALAVRRSLELYDVVDLEEVLFLLERLAQMERDASDAAVFLPRLHAKWSVLGSLGFSFDNVRKQASDLRENLRELIYSTCNTFDRDHAWATYSKLFQSALEHFGGDTLFVATTNYDRIVESLWEGRADGLHKLTPSVGLRNGFVPLSYDNPVLDTSRGFTGPTSGENAVVYLIKLHGSLGWRQYESGRVEETRAREYPADFAVLAYPIRQDKAAEPPFKQLYDVFDRALATATTYALIGTSLRDDAILNRIADGLRAGTKRAVIIDANAEHVRDKLPQEVRKYVKPIKVTFDAGVKLESSEDWRTLLADVAASPEPPNESPRRERQ
jgi:hypothetical protein